MSLTCKQCAAKCCNYFCFEIDEPGDYEEFEDIRWYLCHEGVTVHIDDGDWYISIANKCKMLADDNSCRFYENRPQICRNYSQKGCDDIGGDYGYDEHFETPEQLEEYAKKVLGKKIFDRERAKFRARAEQKARKNQVK